MTDKLPTFDEVRQATSGLLGIPASIIADTGNRTPRVVYARHLAIYVTRQLTFLSWNKLAKQHDQDHQHTVLYAGKKIGKILKGGGEAADKVRSDIKAIIELLKA